VDASRAGQGPLTIDIMYNGKLIPAQIAPDRYREKQFNVKFKPRGAGYYTIRVFFSDVEITGIYIRAYLHGEPKKLRSHLPMRQLSCENYFILLSVCLSVHAQKINNYWSEIDLTWCQCEYALYWTDEVIPFWWHFPNKNIIKLHIHQVTTFWPRALTLRAFLVTFG